VIFPTPEFALFFLLVLPLSWALMRLPWAWKPAMLLASYVFYAAADPKFCLLLGGITVGNQLAARWITATEDDRRRGQIVVGAVVADLLVLGIFKYYGFFVEEILALGHDVGVSIPLPLATIALPAGVSFYTFQAITYVVDVRRRDLELASLTDFALYLSFFPHLVAGPIVRAREFLPQIASPRDASKVAVGAGIVLIGLGLVKKLVVADYLARTVVDPVFAVPQGYGGADVLLAIYAYAAQIYCDFSGYTDMAIGLALLLGIRFPQNFDRPYASLSFQEFWRRWHMTLSRFLRDFLYVPLGGNRGGAWKTARNLMITMMLGGLWHGAAWGFVLWGTIHGGFLVLERVLRSRTSWRPRPWVRWVVAFHLIALAWVPFRATDLSTAGTLLGRLFEPGAATLWSPAAVLVVLGVIGTQLAPRRPLAALRAWAEDRGPVVLGAGLALTILIVGALIPSGEIAPFIYFQF
jgi:D-alanyl-lipoteichoic acid acyltransferase DltB (MBOAT superfamily)